MTTLFPERPRTRATKLLLRYMLPLQIIVLALAISSTIGAVAQGHLFNGLTLSALLLWVAFLWSARWMDKQ